MKKNIFIKNRRGYFLTLDAFIALVLILGIIFIVKSDSSQVSPQMNVQEDLLNVLSSIKIGELNNSYVQGLIANGTIKNLNSSVLEQIGEFYSSSSSYTDDLVNSIMDNMNLSEDVGLYFNNVPLYLSSNYTGAENVWVSRQIISGIQEGNSSRGYSSRAFLSSNKKVDYFYFGGYVGDGNITINLGKNVSSVNAEAVFSNNFSVYINNVYARTHYPTTNIPYTFNLANYSSLFSSGDNEISFRANQSLYIAGGFVKVSYNETEVLSTNKTTHLPGIKGVINFYDSFYVPGELDSMEIYLHYNSSYNIFMNIGNTEIYSGKTNGTDSQIIFNNTYLSSILNYPSMNFKTIPLRLGLENVSYLVNFTMDADVFSVTDLSGSMLPACSVWNMCCWGTNDSCGSNFTCASCGGVWEDKIGMAKAANRIFIDAVLNKTGNRVGLVGYKTSASIGDFHNLSISNVSLKNRVNAWTASGNTCICCGINRAVSYLVANSTGSKYRSMVVMSDGEANTRCTQQGTGNAKQDAIKAACDAYNNYGIITYAVGFGSDVDETTLQSLASCGMGNYYYGDVNELVEVYRQIAEDILDASYYEQTVISEGIHTVLYPDSYVSINYDKEIPYGLVMNLESSTFDNVSSGGFVIPNDTEPYEVKVLSYSGSKWTDKVQVYNSSSGTWSNVFDMSIYNSTYINLGDPYVVNVPLSKLVYGNNTFRVYTALNSENSSYGSPYNKVIYSLVKDLSSYSPIVSSAEGCLWVIQFEDGTNSTFKFPETYSGAKNCFFTSGVVAYNDNDAIDVSIFNLLSDLDLNSNDKVDAKFSENDLKVNYIEVEGIPFTWETEVQARVWK